MGSRWSNYFFERASEITPPDLPRFIMRNGTSKSNDTCSDQFRCRNQMGRAWSNFGLWNQEAKQFCQGRACGGGGGGGGGGGSGGGGGGGVGGGGGGSGGSGGGVISVCDTGGANHFSGCTLGRMKNAWKNILLALRGFCFEVSTYVCPYLAVAWGSNSFAGRTAQSLAGLVSRPCWPMADVACKASEIVA